MRHPIEIKLGFLNVLVIVLTIYILTALAADTFFQLPPEVSKLIHYVDIAMCAVFFVEFWINLYKAKDKLQFLKWGWIDLISSIPNIGLLRFGRVFRLVRIVRVISTYNDADRLLHKLFRNRAQGAFVTVISVAVLLVIFSSITILMVETAPESNIKTAEDALWWTYVTITTVGYGDKYPVTSEGRLIAVLLMTAGIGLFGTFTAYVASWFVADKNVKSNLPYYHTEHSHQVDPHHKKSSE
jgi:voltage-gated potassium channel